MKKTLSIIAVSVLVLGVIYFSGVGYYAEKFSANTTFGSVDISNLTLDEAQAKVVEDLNDKEFVIKEDGTEVARLTVGELAPDYNTTSELKSTYNSQDPVAWVNSFFQPSEYNGGIAESVEVDKDKIAKQLEVNGLTNEGREPAIDAIIDYNEADGYFIIEAEQGTEIDVDLLGQEIAEGLQTENYVIDLEEAYAQPEVTSDSEAITDIMSRIEEVSNVNITYTISGEEVTIPQEEIEKWIYFDTNNDIVIDPALVQAYLGELNEEYSTFYDYREFNSTLQGIVSVPPGILGWGIETGAETEALIADILAGEDVTREPILYSTGGVPGAEDEIGDTYVEIDLSYQAMYLYYEGQLILETPIVSGQIGAETVPGANAVNEMLTDTNLVGYNQFSNVDYSTPVDYWIRFDDKAQGIHDASWQGSFGGNVYQTAGSLGCINTPLGAVATIYEYVDYGTPVIVFY